MKYSFTIYCLRLRCSKLNQKHPIQRTIFEAKALYTYGGMRKYTTKQISHMKYVTSERILQCGARSQCTQIYFHLHNIHTCTQQLQTYTDTQMIANKETHTNNSITCKLRLVLLMICLRAISPISLCYRHEHDQCDTGW